MKHTIIPTVVQTLIDARARIAAGWTQRELSNWDNTKFCAIGAIYMQPEMWLALRYLRIANNWNDIARYNNAPDRTQADILALYDRAIELASMES